MKKKLIFSLALFLGFILVASSVSAATIYEVENGNLGGGAWVEDNEDASGGKFVGGLDSTNDFVELNVNVAEEGNYTLEIGYSNGADDGKLALKVNGDEVSDGVSFSSTVDENGDPQWGIFNKATTKVDLQEGDNTLHFTWKENWIQLDYVKVLDNDSAAGSEDSNENNGATKDENVENPKTSDNGISIYIVLGSLALVGLGAIVYNRKKVLN